MRFAIALSLLIAHLAQPTSASASGDSLVEYVAPRVKSGGQLEFVRGSVVLPHYYGGLGDALGATFTPWCTTDKKQAGCSQDNDYGSCVPYKANCDAFNPLSDSGIGIATNYIWGAVDDVAVTSRCDVEIDLNRLKVASNPSLVALGYARKRKLVMLAIRTIERNLKNTSFQDCSISYKGLSKHPEIGRLPQVIMPVVKACDGGARTRPRPDLASKRRAKMRKLLTSGRHAAALRFAKPMLAIQCDSAEAWLLLAEAFAKTHPFKAQAALLRAYEADQDLALRSYRDNPALDGAKRIPPTGSRSSLFASHYANAKGMSDCRDEGRHRKIVKLETIGPSCVATFDNPLKNRVFIDQRKVPFKGGWDQPDVPRWMQLIADDQAIIGQAGGHPCDMALLDIDSVVFAGMAGDRCVAQLAGVETLTREEKDRRDFQQANAAELSHVNALVQLALKDWEVVAQTCSPEEEKAYKTCRPSIVGKRCSSLKRALVSSCKAAPGKLKRKFWSLKLADKASWKQVRSALTAFVPCINARYYTKYGNGRTKWGDKTADPICAKPMPSLEKFILNADNAKVDGLAD